LRPACAEVNVCAVTSRLRPGQADIERAAGIVEAELTPTPLISSPVLGGDVLLKLETWQPTGSFKVRGALAALSRVGASAKVVTASTGNHALGVAFAADRLGRPAAVVMSERASAAKVEALSRFPVDVILHGDDYESAEQHARDLADAGLRYLSPSNDPDVIAGQATVGVELLNQLPGPFTVVCSIGGGGLASGLGLVASQTGRMTVVGVESAASRAMSTAVRVGQVVPVPVGPTIADGIAGNLEPGSVTVDIIREHVSGLVAVTDEEISAAIRYLAREHGLVAEGAGAAPLAAILAGQVPVSGPTVAVIGGRNIDLAVLAGILLGTSGGEPGADPDQG
jgi:threonine dehydratase